MSNAASGSARVRPLPLILPVPTTWPTPPPGGRGAPGRISGGTVSPDRRQGDGGAKPGVATAPEGLITSFLGSLHAGRRTRSHKHHRGPPGATLSSLVSFPVTPEQSFDQPTILIYSHDVACHRPCRRLLPGVRGRQHWQPSKVPVVGTGPYTEEEGVHRSCYTSTAVIAASPSSPAGRANALYTDRALDQTASGTPCSLAPVSRTVGGLRLRQVVWTPPGDNRNEGLIPFLLFVPRRHGEAASGRWFPTSRLPAFLSVLVVACSYGEKRVYAVPAKAVL